MMAFFSAVFFSSNADPFFMSMPGNVLLASWRSLSQGEETMLITINWSFILCLIPQTAHGRHLSHICCDDRVSLTHTSATSGAESKASLLYSLLGKNYKVMKPWGRKGAGKWTQSCPSRNHCLRSIPPPFTVLGKRDHSFLLQNGWPDASKYKKLIYPTSGFPSFFISMGLTIELCWEGLGKRMPTYFKLEASQK